MSDIYKIKKYDKSLWDEIKYIGSIESKDDIDYINGEYVFEDCVEHRDWYLQSKFDGDIDKFIKIAKKFHFVPDWGLGVLNTELEIVFKNGTWITIGENDGLNWLELHKKPAKWKIYQDIKDK